MNALLDSSELRKYSQIQAKDIVPAAKEAVRQAESKLEEILKQLESDADLSFESTLLAFIEMEEIVENTWNPVENMLSLMGSKEIREESEKARPIVVEFFNKYSLDERAYELIKKYSKTEEAKNLNSERKRYLDNTLRDLVLSGAELSEEDKEKLKKINIELSELSQKFSNNSTDSKFELVVDKEKQEGLPDSLIELGKSKAEEFKSDNKKNLDLKEDDIVINLDYPLYAPFMKFSRDGEARRKLYMKFLNRGTLEFIEETTNDELLIKIFNLKTQKAKLLGFESYAELSLKTKMAKDPQKAKEFLENLGKKSLELAKRDLKDLIEFQKKISYTNTENNPEKIMPWDKEYLSEKLRKQEYEIDENELKQYFELEASLEGMFNIAGELFGISIKETENTEVWHPDVRFYEIANASDSKTIGYMYLDLYPRDIKRQGAWMMPLIQGAELKEGSYRKPQAVCACNLSKATKEQPSLLSHWEITTLFHEFGHALHHLLTEVKIADQAGTNVEWDFVELPSQLFENFVWEKESLKSFAKHHKTGKVISGDLIERLMKSRIFNEGLACCRQIEFALFDLNLYLKGKVESYSEVLDLYKKICSEYGVFEVIEGTNFPCGFEHIFSGGYSAGYYSYKWAEVLEADAFSVFKENGVINAKTGQEYRDKILSRGDSKDPMELFVDFMGRAPSQDALLERMGLDLCQAS